jgi:hypothetical protein
MPLAAAIARATPTKGPEQTSTTGMPRFSSSTVSWILHDVQAPQSPGPVTTAWQVATNCE